MENTKVEMLVNEMKKFIVDSTYTEETGEHGWWVNTDDFFEKVADLLKNKA